MNGLMLSEYFFKEAVYPMLEKEFPDLIERMAAGLVGEGSECFGYDDELSRDHDWGAKVCLWLEKPDYDRIGGFLQQKLNTLPEVYMGYPVCWIPERNGVLEISSFFRKYLGVEGPLKTIGQWIRVPEHHLAVASNGKVFHDPSGKFSDVWNDLRLGYPEDIRLKKIAARCMIIGQSGQYNYPRLKKRDDKVAMSLALNEFIKTVISVVYLLNNKYTPFYKWMYYGMKQLPVLGEEMGRKLSNLITEPDKDALIEEICECLIAEFRRQNITDCNDNYMLPQGESVHQHIRHDGLRSSNPWVEG